MLSNDCNMCNSVECNELNVELHLCHEKALVFLVDNA